MIQTKKVEGEGDLEEPNNSAQNDPPSPLRSSQSSINDRQEVVPDYQNASSLINVENSNGSRFRYMARVLQMVSRSRGEEYSNIQHKLDSLITMAFRDKSIRALNKLQQEKGLLNFMTKNDDYTFRVCCRISRIYYIASMINDDTFMICLGRAKNLSNSISHTRENIECFRAMINMLIRIEIGKMELKTELAIQGPDYRAKRKIISEINRYVDFAVEFDRKFFPEKPKEFSWILETQAIFAKFLGEFRKAKRLFEQSLEKRKEAGDNILIGANYIKQAQVLLKLEELREAEKYIDKGQEHISKVNSGYYEIAKGERIRGLIMLKEGRRDDARRSYLSAWQILGENLGEGNIWSRVIEMDYQREFGVVPRVDYDDNIVVP